MKNLFFVSVAMGIMSGTPIEAKAQPSINLEQVNVSSDGAASIKPSEKNNEVAAIEKCTSIQFKYALLLNMDVEAISNTTLFSVIEDWWGTRYRYGGKTAKGIDCSAYTGTLMSSVYGLELPRTARAQYAASEKVEKDALEQGDLVFFNTRRGVSHVGVYLGNGYFTHAGTSTGVTISSLEESYWSSKFLGGGRFKLSPAEPDKEYDLEIL